MSEKKEEQKVPVKDLETKKDPKGGRGKPSFVITPPGRPSGTNTPTIE